MQAGLHPQQQQEAQWGQAPAAPGGGEPLEVGAFVPPHLLTEQQFIKYVVQRNVALAQHEARSLLAVMQQGGGGGGGGWVSGGTRGEGGVEGGADGGAEGVEGADQGGGRSGGGSGAGGAGRGAAAAARVREARARVLAHARTELERHLQGRPSSVTGLQPALPPPPPLQPPQQYGHAYPQPPQHPHRAPYSTVRLQPPHAHAHAPPRPLPPPPPPHQAGAAAGAHAHPDTWEGELWSTHPRKGHERVCRVALDGKGMGR